MGKRLAAFVAALALAAPALAATPTPSAADGYRFERAEYELKAVSLTFVAVRSQEELERLAAQHGLSMKEWTLKAFTVFGPNSCTVYATDPKLRYEPEFLGHELAHCLYGDFHPEQSKKIK